MSYREEIRSVLKTEGLYGFTRGYQPMLIRDTLNFGLYFMIYENFKLLLHLDQPHQDLSHEQDHYLKSLGNLSKKFIAGGTTGMISWFMSYPMDVIKTKMMTWEDKKNDGLKRP